MIIRDYGEDKFAKNIAKHIVAGQTAEHRSETTGELARDHPSVYPDENPGNGRSSGQDGLFRQFGSN